MDKKITIYSYNGLLLSNKKIDYTWLNLKNITKLKNIDTKEYKLYDSTYVKFKNRQNHGDKIQEAAQLADAG